MVEACNDTFGKNYIPSKNVEANLERRYLSWRFDSESILIFCPFVFCVFHLWSYLPICRCLIFWTNFQFELQFRIHVFILDSHSRNVFFKLYYGNRKVCAQHLNTQSNQRRYLASKQASKRSRTLAKNHDGGFTLGTQAGRRVSSRP